MKTKPCNYEHGRLLTRTEHQSKNETFIIIIILQERKEEEQ